MRLHPAYLAFLIWIAVVIGCSQSRPTVSIKPQPSPAPAIGASPQAKLEWAKTAIREKRYKEALAQLEEISESAPEFKDAQSLIPQTKKNREEQRTKEAPIRREFLRGTYQRLIENANPQLNFIESKFTKKKGGYALWAVHEYFSQFTFSIGSDGKIVQQWVGENRDELLDAGIVRVGVMGKGGFSSWCYFDVR